MVYAQEKVLGMLWGLHAGESLGAPYEFLPPSSAWNQHTEIVGGGKFCWRPGEATDDTDLMLCLLRAIQSPGNFSFDILKNEMLAWLASGPPDIGTTTIRGLRNLQAGLPLKECGFIDNKFQGNGSLMRVAPLSLLEDEVVGCYQGGQYSSLSEIIEVQTKMTHGHQNCVDCDHVMVGALRVALMGGAKEDIYQRALRVARRHSALIHGRLLQVPSLEWDVLPTSGFCVDTLCAGFWALLKFNSFEDAIVAVINRGDDADSCGAVAGALCGAHYGASEIPQRWVERLEYREDIARCLREKNLFF